MKASMSMGVAWRTPFDDRVQRPVDAQGGGGRWCVSEKATALEQSKNVGTRTGNPWQGVAIQGAECTTLLQLTKENLNEMGCIMNQQVTEVRIGKKQGERVKCAARKVEERKKKMKSRCGARADGESTPKLLRGL